MKSYVTAAVVFTLAVTAAVQVSGQDRGLHNDSKAFIEPGLMKPSDITSVAEMKRTWARAIVRVPNKRKGSRKLTTAKLPGWKNKKGHLLPAVVYLHGCSGIWPGTHARVKFMADQGFVVVAPASMARLKYPRSCNVKTNEGGMYRPTLRMRQADAGYAIEQVKALPFVDPDKVILMGLSQGGWSTATFQPKNRNQRVAARIVEGTTCHAGWPEYVGLRARADEPVLTLLGIKDPWYQNKWTRGECTKFINRKNGSKSVVYRKGPLANVHELLDHRAPKKEVSAFLRVHRFVQ